MKETMTQVVVRSPKKTDAQALLSYLKQVGSESDNLTFGEEGHPNSLATEEEFLEVLQTSQTQLMRIAILNQEIIASASLGRSIRPRLRHTVELGISVLKAYWNQGIATLLLKEILKDVQIWEDVEQVVLHVRKDNLNAIKLYEKFGFQTTGSFPNQIKIKDQTFDTLFMVKFLRKGQE